MIVIRYLCKLNCASWLPHLRISGSELGWTLVFDLGLSVGMVLVAPVGSLLEYPINKLLGLENFNSFGTWEVYLVGFSLLPLAILVIGTVGGYLVGLSLVLPLGSPLESPNPGTDLPGTLLGVPLGLRFESETVSCMCY